MPLDLFTEILEKIHNHTTHIYLHVKGEPLLHPQLSLILDLCYEKNLKVVLVTNGTLLAEKGEMLLTKPALHQVNISLHCFNELPNLKNKNAYINTVIEFSKNALLHSQLTISLRFWNIEKGDKSKNINNQILFNSIEKEFAPDLELEDVIIAGKGLKLRERLYINSDFEFIWPSILDDVINQKGFCYALRDQIAVLTDGTVVPCCLDAEGIINLGNIRESNLQQIIDSDRARKMYDGFSNSVPIEMLCRKCRFMERFERPE